MIGSTELQTASYPPNCGLIDIPGIYTLIDA